MAKNYLPFARKETLNIPPSPTGAKLTTGGFAVTDLARMASGGTQRAIIQDIMIYPVIGALSFTAADAPALRIRIGIDGRNYMTEDLYDYRVFADKPLPYAATWDWSCGGRTPYRLYPGQSMKVWMNMSPRAFDSQRLVYRDIPLAVMFNGLKVAHGSPVGIKEGEPILLYAKEHPADRNDAGLIALQHPAMRLNCPKDAPVDLYSVTVPECFLMEYILGTVTAFQIVYIEDGNERPFWDSRLFTAIVDQPCSAISFGYGGTAVEPDETLRIDIENADPNLQANLPLWVTYRGVLEVEDGR